MDSEFSTPPERKPQKASPIGQRTIKIAVIIIALLVIAGAAVGAILFFTANDNKDATAQTEQQSFNRIRNDVDKATDYTETEAKESVKFGYFDVKVNSVTRGYLPQDGSLPRENSEYLLVNLAVTNPTKDTHLLSSLDVAVLTKDDVLINSAFVRVDPMIDTVRIEGDATVEGNLIFEVPTAAEGLKLYYNTQIYNDEVQKLERLEYSILLEE